MTMCEMWPEADIFTAVYDEKPAPRVASPPEREHLVPAEARPTSRTFRALLPFYPTAIESFDLSGYDLVVSSSSAWAHAVLCDESTVHVSYCHNPFRYAWNDRDQTLASRRNPITRSALRSLFRRWRQWDWIAAQRVDHYVTNSPPPRRGSSSYLGRDATIVYPPVETTRFSPGTVGDHYLVLSELMRHKRIEPRCEPSTRSGGRSWWWATAPTPPPRAPRRPERELHGPPHRRRARPAAAELAGTRRGRGGGVRHRRRGGPGRRPARDRRAQRRHPRDGQTGRHGLFLERRPGRARRRGQAGFDDRAVDPKPTAPTTRPASAQTSSSAT